VERERRQFNLLFGYFREDGAIIPSWVLHGLYEDSAGRASVFAVLVVTDLVENEKEVDLAIRVKFIYSLDRSNLQNRMLYGIAHSQRRHTHANKEVRSLPARKMPAFYR